MGAVVKNSESFFLSEAEDNGEDRTWFKAEKCPLAECCKLASWKNHAVWSYKGHDEVVGYCMYHLMNSSHHNLSETDAAEAIEHFLVVNEMVETSEERAEYRKGIELAWRKKEEGRGDHRSRSPKSPPFPPPRGGSNKGRSRESGSSAAAIGAGAPRKPDPPPPCFGNVPPPPPPIGASVRPGALSVDDKLTVLTDSVSKMAQAVGVLAESGAGAGPPPRRQALPILDVGSGSAASSLVYSVAPPTGGLDRVEVPRRSLQLIHESIVRATNSAEQMMRVCEGMAGSFRTEAAILRSAAEAVHNVTS